MENKLHNDESRIKCNRELPLHLRLMDVYLEQVEKGIPLLTTMLNDLQTVYISGTRMALKAGEMMEERSKANLGFFRGVSKSIETGTPVITEAQTAVTKVMVDSACRGIRIIRDNMKGLK